MARFSQAGGSGSGAPGPQGADGKDSLFLGTWNSVTEFLAAYQGGPVGLADGDWWAFVKDNTNPNKIYVVREDPNSATGWVIDDNEHFVLPQGTAGADGSSTLLKGSFNYFGDLDITITNANIGDTYLVLLASPESLAGNLWTWNGTGWTNAGQILGPQGEPGEDGAPGAPGERGVSALSWTYKAQTGIADVDPGNDYLNFNSTPFTSSTQIRVDDNPYGLNTTLHDLFLSIQSGYLSITSQSDPSSYATFNIVSCVDGTATNETLDGSYVIFNVSLVSTYGAINNEDFITLSIAPVGQQGAPGADGADGNDGADGAQGPQGDPGSPGLVYLGNYVSGNGYIANLAVVKGSDNNLYIATSSGGLGDPVGNSAEWSIFLPKGSDGAPGADALWDYLGEYNGGITYSAGAVVTYDGQLWYRNVYTSAGYVPGVGNTYWDLLAAKGADGNNGTSFTSRGAWTDSENYAINDIVTFEGSAYVCIVGVTAGTDVAPYPQHIGAYWNLLISGSTVDTGQITFVGVYIIGAGGGSGDGAGNGTIKLMPDEDLVQQQYHEDQYLIIDPTSPNHIHIRAGGVQDASTADLFLGAERTGVQVSDGSGNVIIRSKNPDLVFNYVNAHTSSTTTFIANTPTAEMNTGDYLFFDSIKYTIGSKLVVGETTEYDALSDANVPMQFIAGANYTFYRNMGEDRWMFQTDGITFPNNTVQTDAFPGGATGTFMSSDNQLITVTNGIITSIDPLT